MISPSRGGEYLEIVTADSMSGSLSGALSALFSYPATAGLQQEMRQQHDDGDFLHEDDADNQLRRR